MDVTTAARRADPIRNAAAPIQVLTRDDLHRAGVRYLAEAFRLADGLYVGRFDGRTWIVNGRGLAINGANKMQVMIDGRSIYSPLFSGIFWDAQDVLIEDIDRIEIIRGPGASLWGANSVHGIINVITRRAADTQGTLVTVGSGNEEQAITDVRYGGRISDSAAFRAYAKYGYRDAQSLASGESAQDPMRRGQIGGRLDWQASKSGRRDRPGGCLHRQARPAELSEHVPSPVATSSRGGHGETPGASRRHRRSTTGSRETCPISSASAAIRSTSTYNRTCPSSVDIRSCLVAATVRPTTTRTPRRSCSSSPRDGQRTSSMYLRRTRFPSGEASSLRSGVSWSTTPTADGSSNPRVVSAGRAAGTHCGARSRAPSACRRASTATSA